jgi:hypothetical protein
VVTIANSFSGVYIGDFTAAPKSWFSGFASGMGNSPISFYALSLFWGVAIGFALWLHSFWAFFRPPLCEFPRFVFSILELLPSLRYFGEGFAFCGKT